MSNTIIRVENLGKKYVLNHQQESSGSYKALRDVIADGAKSLGKTILKPSRKEILHSPYEDFWALNDVSFEIKQGDRVGIIGRNGAGKSTLLKILSRITEPTNGKVAITGRVASLLEVGTGFHPELTGRENIFLNGAILGMSKVEIERKFDEIVDFAEVEKFLDTPVKRYSSGMYVRLAFAVAAHLEPEILIVDEVLAVGDAAFQKKCLGKMDEVAEKEGRTVLFVSHSMAAITTLCNRALLMNAGRMIMDDTVSEVTTYYQTESLAIDANKSSLHDAERKGSGKAKFSYLTVQPCSKPGESLPIAYAGCDLEIVATIEATENIIDANVAVIIYDINQYRLIDINTAKEGMFLSLKGGEKALVKFVAQKILLKPGTYFVGLWLGRGGVEEIDKICHGAKFTIEENPEGQKHVETFPGPYLCEFDSQIIR
jgi:lipopolysaccharide transport system ATP-binding protein